MTNASRADYEKAIDLFAQGRGEEAAAALEALVAREPGHADALESLGMIYYRLGRLDEAIDRTLRLAELKPDLAMAHTNLSVFYMKKGWKEKAEEEKAKATVLSFGPKNP
jgi:Flp pilus assembly protein TadD